MEILSDRDVKRIPDAQGEHPRRPMPGLYRTTVGFERIVKRIVVDGKKETIR